MHQDRHPLAPWLYPLTDLRPQQEVWSWSTADDLVTLMHVRGAEEGRWLVLRQSSGRWLVHVPEDDPTSTPD